MRLPGAMQRLMYRTPWDADMTQDSLQEFAIEHVGDAEGIGRRHATISGGRFRCHSLGSATRRA